jgi:hypothetical protein
VISKVIATGKSPWQFLSLKSFMFAKAGSRRVRSDESAKDWIPAKNMRE